MISAPSRSTALSVALIASLACAAVLVSTQLPITAPRAIAVVVAVVLGLCLLFKSPRLFVSLYFAAVILLPAFVYTRVGPVYVTEVFLAALMLQRVLSSDLNSLVSPMAASRRIAWPLLALVLLGLLSLVRGYRNGMLAARDSATVFYCLLVFLIPPIFKSWRKLKKLSAWIVSVGLILNVLLLVKMVTQGFSASEMATPRLFGARTSAFLFLVGCLAVSGVVGGRTSTRKRLRFFGVAQFCIIILLSGTRNVWIASILAFLFWSFFIRRTAVSPRSVIRYALLLAVFGVAILSLSESQYKGDSMTHSFSRAATSIVELESSASATNRLEWWKEAFTITLSGNPLLGKPFGSMTLFAEYDPKYDAVMKMSFHNSYVTIMYYTGFLGLALMGLFVFRTLRLGVRQSIRFGASPRGKLNTAFTLSFFFYCVVAFFNVILEGPQSAMFFWLLAGLLIALRSLPDEQEKVAAA